MATEYFTGADCTGSSGATNRTLTLSNTSLTTDDNFQIYKSGSLLTPTTHYTVVHTASSTVITFVVNVWDDENIAAIYGTGVTDDTSEDLVYTNVSDFAEVLQIKEDVPSWSVSETPTKENVGDGDDSEDTFYLDQQNIIEDSYTLYSGSSSDDSEELEETTEYTIDKDKGKITLTAAGVTAVGTDTIFAEYSYISNGMRNSYLLDVLKRAEIEVDSAVNSTFTNGNLANPSYPSETEIQPSQGYYQDQIIVEKKPLIDVESTLASDITSSATSIALASGDGDKFPSSGKIIVGSEVISYTGISTDTLTGCTRGVLGTTAASHDEDDEVHTTIFFVSGTAEGTQETFVAQKWDTEMHASDTGLIYKFNDRITSGTTEDQFLTQKDVANRIKIIYYYGYDTIPQDIKRLTYLLAKRMLMQDNIGKSMISGRNEFRPEMFNVDMEEIKRIVNKYIVLSMGNT